MNGQVTYEPITVVQPVLSHVLELSGDISVFRASFHPVSDGDLRAIMSSLKADERATAMSYQSQRAARNYILARRVLRQLVAWRLDCDPSLIHFSKDHNGKPFIMPLAGRVPLHFSTSRSEDSALITFRTAGEIGIDFEIPHPCIDVQTLAASALSAAELQSFSSIRAVCRDTAETYFYRLWTMKEAFLKASGVGLRLSPKLICLARHVSWNDYSCRNDVCVDVLAQSYAVLDISGRSYFAATATLEADAHQLVPPLESNCE